MWKENTTQGTMVLTDVVSLMEVKNNGKFHRQA